MLVAMGAPDPAQLLTALTTEHFTLQGARSQTMSETSARASVYMYSVSSALVALGFVSQIADGVGAAFRVFALDLWLATTVGVLVAAASIAGWLVYAGRLLGSAATQASPRYPSPRLPADHGRPWRGGRRPPTDS
jgi:hypothetical protein